MNTCKKIATLLAGLLLAGAALAADPYPNKPVMLMVPYPAGGPSDALARVLTQPLGQKLGQPVLVENLGGVSGALGAQKVLSAPADGYYIFQGTPNEVILSPLANAAVKVKAEDFRLVHPLADAVMVLLVRKDLPAANVDELIELAKKSKDKPLNYGSVGIGSLYHFIVEDLQHRTGIKATHVPYKGNAPLLQDVAGGQVDFAVLVYSAAMGAMADQGRLKVIGQLGAQRSELLKNVPTLTESKGLKDFAFRQWSGLMVRKETPENIVQRLHTEITAVLQDAAVISQLAAQTQSAARLMSLPEAAKYFESETARYRALAKQINLQPQ